MRASIKMSYDSIFTTTWVRHKACPKSYLYEIKFCKCQLLQIKCKLNGKKGGEEVVSENRGL